MTKPITAIALGLSRSIMRKIVIPNKLRSEVVSLKGSINDARSEASVFNQSLSVSPKSTQQRGFSLVEILISIVILSFGLLGMAGMQAAALQANKESRSMSIAVRMARELGELMRSNKVVGVGTTTTSNPYLISYSNPTATPVDVPTATANCFTTTCTATDTVLLASFEVQDWLTRLNAELPGVRVEVCFDSTPYDSSGLPQWACSSTGDVAVIKIGWSRGSTNRAATGADAIEKATKPALVLPVTAGSST